jgi:hypothetical protein
MKKLGLILILFLATAAIVAAQKRITVPTAPRITADLSDLFQMSEDEEREYLKSLNPNLRADLEEIKKLNKERYYDLLRDAHFTRFDFPFMGKREKEEMEVEKRIAEYNISTELLGLKYQTAANNSAKSEIKGVLIKKLGELFELKETQRKMEVAQLQKELEELKKSLEVRKNNKDAIVQKRFNELTGMGDYLDWD